MQTRELVQSAQGGNDEALSRLATRYFSRVQRIVRARLGPALRRRVEEADIVQEVFLQVVLRLGEFEMRSEGAFLDWISAMVKNQILKAAEHHGRAMRDMGRTVELDAPSDSVTQRVRELRAQVTGPLTRALRGERGILLEEALDELEEGHREVLILRHLVGLSHSEIAERTGRPSEAAAREFYRRARALLAMVLHRRGIGASSLG